ncbi:MAG: manganese efflux pump [Peptococcaceae bacterium]|nr:manganese efflux pump [Peptococcaceae bacterium]
MTLVTLLLLAVALGTDAFSLCLALGLAGITRRQGLLLVLVILVMHIVMPVIGWWAGEWLGSIAGRWAALIGAVVLVYLGLKMTVYSLREGQETVDISSVASYGGILLVGVSVSMDALSVGFSLGATGAALFMTALVFGIVAGTMTALALVIGRQVGIWVGQRAQLVGGLILVGIGLRLVM